MAPVFAYVMEELITGHPDISEQEAYYNGIIESVIETVAKITRENAKKVFRIE